MSKDLRQFLETVRRAGPDYYREIKKPLNPVYEVSTLQQKLAKSGRNPVLYCPEIQGSAFPLVTSLFASYEILGLALDIPLDQLRPGNWEIVLQEYRKRLTRFQPVKEVPSSSAPVREVVWQGKDADLGRLPIIKHAELNPAKYITIGMTVLRDPDTGRPNAGVYRQEIKGKNRIAIMTASTHHGYTIGRRYQALKRPMEAAIAIGHHPAVFMAAAGSRPGKTEDEFELIGAIINESLEVTRGLTVDLLVPARAEIIIEGTIDPARMEQDGPFSEGAGYYGEGKPCYILEVSAITMRRNAIYHDLNPVHAEHNLVGLLEREASLWQRVAAAGVDARAVHIGPDEQVGKLIMYVAIKKRAADDAHKAGNAALGSGFAKLAVVVDDDIDVYDEHEVLWALATRLNDAEVVTVGGEQAAKGLNPSGVNNGGTGLSALNRRLCLDATLPLGQASPIRVVPPADMWTKMKIEEYLK